MTYNPNTPNDPNMRRRGYRGNEGSYTGWIIGAVALALVLFGVFFMMGPRDTNVADRPAATTTGSAVNTPAVKTPARETTGSAVPGDRRVIPEKAPAPASPPSR